MIKIVLPALLALVSFTPLWATLTVSNQVSCSAHSNGATGVNACYVLGEPSLIIPYSSAHSYGYGFNDMQLQYVYLSGYADVFAAGGSDYDEATQVITSYGSSATATTEVEYKGTSGGPVRPGIAALSLYDQGSFGTGYGDMHIGTGLFEANLMLRAPDLTSGPGMFNITLGTGFTVTLSVSAFAVPPGGSGSPGYATSSYSARLNLFEADRVTPVSILSQSAADPVPEPGTILLSSAALAMGLAAIRLKRKLQ